MARSRRVSRARSRRNRRHRRGIAPWAVFLVAALAVLAGGVFLESRGLLSELQIAPNGSQGQLTSSRFAGSDGIEIPDTAPPDWWWTRVVVDDGVRAPTIDDGADSGQYSRVLIPTDVLFGRDSTTITEDSMGALRDIAATVTSPAVEVIVVCHSSRDGASADRKPLSERRADEVATALEELLTRPEGSIERIGMGDEQPLPGIDQTTESGLALNRRCEVYIGLGA